MLTCRTVSLGVARRAAVLGVEVQDQDVAPLRRRCPARRSRRRTDGRRARRSRPQRRSRPRSSPGRAAAGTGRGRGRRSSAAYRARSSPRPARVASSTSRRRPRAAGEHDAPHAAMRGRRMTFGPRFARPTASLPTPARRFPSGGRRADAASHSSSVMGCEAARSASNMACICAPNSCPRIDGIDLVVVQEAAPVEVGRADGRPHAVDQRGLGVQQRVAALVDLHAAAQQLAVMGAPRVEHQPEVRRCPAG